MVGLIFFFERGRNKYKFGKPPGDEVLVTLFKKVILFKIFFFLMRKPPKSSRYLFRHALHVHWWPMLYIPTKMPHCSENGPHDCAWPASLGLGVRREVYLFDVNSIVWYPSLVKALQAECWIENTKADLRLQAKNTLFVTVNLEEWLLDNWPDVHRKRCHFMWGYPSVFDTFLKK